MVVWLVDTVYNRTLPRQQMGAVVAQKSWTTFPRTIVWVRRDRKDCSVVFQLPDMGSNMTLPYQRTCLRRCRRERRVP